MRIKQIELTGFKSFMERTVLELPRGVTAVVGPNGCGKSNIVDAIREVAGSEQTRGTAVRPPVDTADGYGAPERSNHEKVEIDA